MEERHAYLIIAHNEPELLKILLRLIDDDRNDIYLHIDKKANMKNDIEFLEVVKKSKIKIYREYNIKWGHQSQVKCEIFLIKEANKRDYRYFHIISGSDLPIKTQDEIHEFFKANDGYEFIHYDKRRIDEKEFSRVNYYHFLSRFFKISKFKAINKMIFILDNLLVSIQKLIGIKRIKDINLIKKGCNWCSITNELAKYILLKNDEIEKLTSFTKCADEIFIQTVVEKSAFKYKLFNNNYDNNYISCCRLIEWNSENKNRPYIFRSKDYERIIESSYIFVRKFSMKIDSDIVYKICDFIRSKEAKKCS